MTKHGFIKLHRKIQDHWIYQEKRKFSKYEAWLDMLMMANHKENKFVHGNELIHVNKGEFVSSIRKLGERWDWSNTKVTQFLDLLKSDEMITYKKDTKKTAVTIVNYGIYHGYEVEKNTQNEHEKDTERTQKHTNKNVKECPENEKNEKEEILISAFDSFWEVYPRKLDKKKAFEKFKIAAKKHDPQIIIQGAENYVKECQVKGTEKSYIKHPTSFLNAESFLNDFDTSYSPPGQARTGQGKKSLFAQGEESRKRQAEAEANYQPRVLTPEEQAEEDELLPF